MPVQTENVIKRNNHRDIAINIRAGKHIWINRTVLQALKNPMYLNFWWGEEKNVLAISTSDAPMDMSVFVPNYFYKTRRGSKLSNWKLMRAIQPLTGWEENSVHRLVGEFIPELCMVIFKTAGESQEFENE